MKGQMLDLGLTIVFIIIAIIIVTAGIFTILFAHRNQVTFSTEYTELVGKPYSISEPLFLQNIDDRSVLDHALAISITKDKQKAQLTSDNPFDSIKLFFDQYDFGFYSFDIISESTDGESIGKQEKVENFCGNVAEKCGLDTDGDGNPDQPCIAYCDETAVERKYRGGPDKEVILVPAGCKAPGRTEYIKGNSLCQRTTCCVESKYDWQSRIFQTNEQTCAAGKGICQPSCGPGRFHQAAGDSDCPINPYAETFKIRNQCCVPIHPDEIEIISDLATEISVPLLYKTTKNDVDGVLGYVKIGVSSD